MKSFNYVWHDPTEIARAVNRQEGDSIFLHSTMHVGFSGQYSLLAFNPIENVQSSDFSAFNKVLTEDGEKYSNAWFGYLGYELLHELEVIPQTQDASIKMPNLWMTRFAIIMIFDHSAQRCTVWCQDDKMLQEIPEPIAQQNKSAIKVKSITSNMTKAEYEHKVQYILDAINKGDLYQANVTRKFYGELESSIDEFELFITLSQVSPAPYSAYLKLGACHILSSSPEQFLSMDEKGSVQSRPIKGSAPRHENKEDDEASLQELRNSTKDQSENLMIVDLMRNDFSRGCKAGTVKVDELFNVTSYQTVHHMASNIYGQKRQDISPLNFVSNCFPPGSMTGAPKIKAMEYCAQLEKQNRGIYSGGIGWFGGDGSLDLSVVIRTLIISKKKFEFQVGGAIVADSTPEGEWKETLVKARGVAKVLGLDPDKDLVF